MLIPDKLEGALQDYNEMQRKQGCDLSRHLGQRCDQYTYEITNYPNSEQTVLVTLYVQGNLVNNGKFNDKIVSQDPDRCMFAYSSRATRRC